MWRIAVESPSSDRLTVALEGDFAGIIVQRYTQSEIKHAGKLISSKATEVTEELARAYQTAHAWREAHVYPMRSIRSELTRFAHRAPHWALTAGRLKRFQSIRRKLQRLPHSLYDMQDIGGCRAICGSMAEVERICGLYRQGRTRHGLVRENDYIERPKRGGYRSNHFVLKYAGPDEISAGNRLTVEVQVRTTLQHAWATSVEAIGLVIGQELKSGKGDPDWLRLFELMSGEFAAEEGKPLVPGVPEDLAIRREELIDLERRLDATRKMVGYNTALKQAQDISGMQGHAYLIDFNPETMTVSVRSFGQFALTSQQYYNTEMAGVRNQTNTVLVEVDALGDLCAAYPNYFMDMRQFTDRLAGYANVELPEKPGRPVYRAPQPTKYKLGWLKDAKYLFRGEK